MDSPPRRGGEWDLIQKIRKFFRSSDPAVVCGIGDDAAVLKPSKGKVLLLTVDTLREGTHFLPAFQDPYSLGWKSLAVSLSDIAAMGGVPRFCLFSLALPVSYPDKDLTAILTGMRRILQLYPATLVGGNLSRSRKGVSLDTTVIGECPPDAWLGRDGARVGDGIYVTGTVGDAAAGLELLKRGAGRAPHPKMVLERSRRYLMQRHQQPSPRVEEGRLLAERQFASSAVDISDGLLQDLSHLCTQSGVGAQVDVRLLPFSKALMVSQPLLRRTPAHYALRGGEDYELLFTVPPARLRQVEAHRRQGRLSVTRIGTILGRQEGLSMIDTQGRLRWVSPVGYDHFRGRSEGTPIPRTIRHRPGR